MLIALQFQDRVSQILRHVMADQERLTVRLAEAEAQYAAGIMPPLIDVHKWLEELSRSYSTTEQQHIHQGSRASAPAATEITFF